ncbi:PTS fructose transporter subunit IIABC [Nocardioides aequoreus]|uniref:PTS fructose transporter subunit IIABC n=1 Tax=Nocardioides aequoreus TaxID=397278 RepID=UPI0004C2FF6C|nr:fructose-specific PTS transporter subunit EIIC [Nocardioides aequoreus]
MTERLLTPDLVRLDADLGDDKETAIRRLAAFAAEGGRTTDPDQLAGDALARESTAATGLPGGIAIPHCRTAAVQVPTLVFARPATPVAFGAKDGPADLVFLIAAPEGGGQTHLQVLTKLARALVRPDFTASLRAAATPDEVAALVGEVVDEAPAPAPAAAPAAAPEAPAPDETTSAAPARRRSLVAVTACPTGIAHTYMAAEALETAAAKAGVDIAVETQGSAGATPLPREVIERADAVIFSVDVGVREKHRFAGKPVVATGVKRAIEDGDGLVALALAHADDPSAPRVQADGGDAGASATSSSESESWGARTRRVLMTGVSYMIPFVAAGGLLIALGFLLGGYSITGPGQDIALNNSLFNLPDLGEAGLSDVPFDSPLLAYFGALAFTLGAAAFGFLVPALAGYIAFAIADRPGIAPGFVMGAIAVTLQSGFLGGIVGGVLAGVVALWISRWRIPAWARGLMPVVVIPLLATVIAGLVMVVVLARPLAGLMSALTDGLNSLDGGSAILLGAILGLMMAFDMGGPLNKTAYAFATAGLGAAAAASGDSPELRIMASVMLAGMVPPLALALATVVRPRLFTPVERENGKAAWLLGASFITEGAIPFAAADPLRVIPSIMLGSAVTGAISMAGDVTLRAPHGGIFVLFAVGNILWFLVALVIGTLVATASVVALKQLASSSADTREAVAA